MATVDKSAGGPASVIALLALAAFATAAHSADPPQPRGYDLPTEGQPASSSDGPARGYDLPTDAAPPTDAPAESGVVALSPQEREAVLEAAANNRNADGIEGDHRRGVHGEVGFMLGSQGTQALYGSTVVPLGQTGTAAFSFMTARDNWTYRH